MLSRKFTTIFKRQAILTISLVGLTLLSPSCGSYFNDLPKFSSPESSFGKQEFGCLRGASTKIGRYLEGRTDREGMAKVTECFDGALNLFVNFIQGRQDDRFASGELKQFLEDFFLDGLEVPQSFNHQIMNLKVAILGGSPDHLTFEEIERTRSLLQIIAQVSREVHPYLPLTSEDLGQLSADQIGELQTALVGAGDQIQRWMGSAAGDYSLADGLLLLDATIEFVGRDGGSTESLQSIRGKFGLVPALKALVLGGDPMVIRHQQWIEVVDDLFAGLGTLLRVSHAVHRHTSMDAGEGLEQLLTVGLEVRELLNQIVARHPNEEIPFEVFDRLFNEAESAELLKLGDTLLPALALKQTIRPLFRRVFAGSLDSERGRFASGLTREMVDRMWLHFRIWADGQKYIDQSFEYAKNRRGAEFSFYPRDLLLRPTLNEGMGWTFGNDEYSHQIIDDVRVVIGERRPLFQPDGELVFINASINEPSHSRTNLTLQHQLRSVTRFAFSGFARNFERSESFQPSLTREEFSQSFRALAPVPVAMGMFRSVAATWPIERFRDANLLTLSANGDSYLDFEETQDITLFILSGIKIAKRAIREMAEICPMYLDGENPVDGAQPNEDGKNIDLECFREQFYGNIGNYFDYLPKMKEFYQELDDAGKLKFRCNLETAGMKSGYSNRPIGGGDIAGFYSISQLMEGLMAKYDTNRNGSLNREEAMRLYPRFRRTLFTLGEGRLQSDRELRLAYIYLLSHGGELPNGLGFLIWRDFASHEFEASRMTLTSIMAMLALKSDPNRVRPPGCGEED